MIGYIFYPESGFDRSNWIPRNHCALKLDFQVEILFQKLVDCVYFEIDEQSFSDEVFT